MGFLVRAAVSLISLAVAAHVFGQGREPVMVFRDRTIEVSGFPPGSPIAIFGVTHTDRQFVKQIERVAEVLVDSDKDGTVVLSRETPIPIASVFVAVDLHNGRLASGTGDGTDVRWTTRREPGLHKGRSGKVDRLAINWTALELLYAHAGRAWGWSVVDGGPDDGDGDEGADGKVMMVGARARSLQADAPSFDELAKGGTLVAIDPMTLEVAVVRVDKALLDGAR